MLQQSSAWTFITNHAHVLYCLAKYSDARLRDVAAEVGMTERGVQRIVRELVEAGYVTPERHGRRNCYRVHVGQPLRRPCARHCHVEELLGLLTAH